MGMIIALFLSALLIAIIYGTCRPSNPSMVVALVTAAVGTIIGYVLLLPLFMLHALLVFVALVIWRAHRGLPRTLLLYMLLAAVVPYGIATYLSVNYMAEIHRLQKEYAFESMETRVPAPKAVAVAKLSFESQKQLTNLDSYLAESGSSARFLQQLHQDSLTTFLDSPGFGAQRRIRPSAYTLKMNANPDEFVPRQPGPPSASRLMEYDLRDVKDLPVEPLRELHLDSVFNFSNPGGFGWIVNRQKVAGFLPHQFKFVPQARQWKIQTLELVGLLMHETPIAYLSDELPRMANLPSIPTRPLTPFESAALKQLQEGGDIVVKETSDSVRMLGAVRSAAECTKCHGGERGDLLGAFSYWLERVP
jgi:hypothetical protein